MDEGANGPWTKRSGGGARAATVSLCATEDCISNAAIGGGLQFQQGQKSNSKVARNDMATGTDTSKDVQLSDLRTGTSTDTLDSMLLPSNQLPTTNPASSLSLEDEAYEKGGSLTVSEV
jgi:hypothetical protein